MIEELGDHLEVITLMQALLSDAGTHHKRTLHRIQSRAEGRYYSPWHCRLTQKTWLVATTRRLRCSVLDVGPPQ